MPVLDQNGGSKTVFFFGPPFGSCVGPAWLPLATTWSQKGAKMAPKRLPKEGPGEYVKSCVFDRRYFKIAPRRGRKWGNSDSVSGSPLQIIPDPLFWPAGKLLGAFWGHLWRPKGSQKGPESDPKSGSQMGLESRLPSRGGGVPLSPQVRSQKESK